MGSLEGPSRADWLKIKKNNFLFFNKKKIKFLIKFKTKIFPKFSRNPNGTLFTLSTSIFSHFFQFSIFPLKTIFPFWYFSHLREKSDSLKNCWKGEKKWVFEAKMNLTEVSRSYVIGQVPIEVEKALKIWLARFPTGKRDYFHDFRKIENSVWKNSQ